ncbi:MAG: hypothetical protein ABFD91_10605 [Anaerohalosphaeraceae bacterium]
MKTSNTNPCKTIRQRLVGMVDSVLNRGWGSYLRNHIDHCPKCAERLVGLQRVEFAFLLLKSQPHRLDLLTRANTAALGMLKHQLRFAPRADMLRTANPEPHWTSRYGPGFEKILNVAACLLIIVLIKCGTTSFLKDIHKDGSQIMHNYYAKNLGQDIADELIET